MVDYVVVDYSDVAKRWKTFTENNLRIFYYSGGSVVKEEPFSIPKIKSLMENNIPVVWQFKNTLIQAREPPSRYILFHKIVWGDLDV